MAAKGARLKIAPLWPPRTRIESDFPLIESSEGLLTTMGRYSSPNEGDSTYLGVWGGVLTGLAKTTRSAWSILQPEGAGFTESDRRPPLDKNIEPVARFGAITS